MEEAPETLKDDKTNKGGSLLSELTGLVSNFARFSRRHLQCRFGVHWVRIGDITAEHNCPDCGEYFPAYVWPRCSDKKVETCADHCESTFPCDYTCGEGAEPS